MVGRKQASLSSKYYKLAIQFETTSSTFPEKGVLSALSCLTKSAARRWSELAVGSGGIASMCEGESSLGAKEKTPVVDWPRQSWPTRNVNIVHGIVTSKLKTELPEGTV